MTFTPGPGKIQIEPIVHPGEIILSEEKKFDEVGTVIAVGEGVDFVKAGDVVFFLSYGYSKTGEYEGKSYGILDASSRFILGKCA